MLNPLLIELRPHLGSEAEVLQTIQQMRQFMARKQFTTALVLYQGAEQAAVRDMHTAPILFLSVEGFLEGLRGSSFGEVIRRLQKQNLARAN